MLHEEAARVLLDDAPEELAGGCDRVYRMLPARLRAAEGVQVRDYVEEELRGECFQSRCHVGVDVKVSGGEK